MTRSRFLSPQEKTELLRRWETTKANFARRVASGEITGETAGRGFPDPDVYGLVDALNSINGICTTQSCSGHRVYPDESPIGRVVMPDGETLGPTLWSGQVWLRTSRAIRDVFIERVEELASDSHIERVGILLGPSPNGDIIDIVFQGLNAGETVEDGRRMLAETQDILMTFFQHLARQTRRR